MNRLRLVATLYFLALLFAAALNYLPFIPVVDGKTFGIFALDIYDDALHLASALWAGAAAWLGARASRTFLAAFGLLYLADGLLGLATGSGYLDLGIVNYGIQDLPVSFKILANLPHLGLGGLAVIAVYLFPERRLMGRLIGKVLKWILAGIVLVIVGLAAPIAYVETSCHAPVTVSAYEPLLRDPVDRRPEANTYLTYPEWHIVYAYDGLAEILKTSDEYDFDYASSVWQFWSATCALTRVADGHGGADGDTRLMIYTIGASFTLEMALKAGYEETVGRIFAAIRGPVKTPQDELAAAMATGYAAFLRQTPWYRYDFENEVLMLWAAPVTNSVRGWERRLALGGEWKAKTAYARAIEAGVAATGVAKLSIRSVVQGMDEAALGRIADVTIVSTSGDGIVIETPRYARFTQILSQIAREGGTIREIAGNDDIIVTVTVPPGDDYVGPGEVVTRLSREGFWSERVLVDTKVTDLARLIAAHPPGDPGLEHVFDY